MTTDKITDAPAGDDLLDCFHARTPENVATVLRFLDRLGVDPAGMDETTLLAVPDDVYDDALGADDLGCVFAACSDRGDIEWTCRYVLGMTDSWG